MIEPRDVPRAAEGEPTTVSMARRVVWLTEVFRDAEASYFKAQEAQRKAFREMTDARDELIEWLSD